MRRLFVPVLLALAVLLCVQTAPVQAAPSASVMEWHPFQWIINAVQAVQVWLTQSFSAGDVPADGDSVEPENPQTPPLPPQRPPQPGTVKKATVTEVKNLYRP